MSEALGQIRQSAERAANLTRQLLAFARRQVARPRSTDLNELIEELGRMLRRVIGEQIELKLDLAPNLPKLYVDPGQIEQILLNMALNAKDAMPKGGKLGIRTEACQARDCLFRSTAQHPQRDHILLEISDSGVGIPEEIQSKIFEPFFTTKHQSQGTGLGLAMCYGIVRQSGGVIDLVSAPGKGASFRIYLPILSGPIGTPDRGDETPMQLGGSETVLVAEDERSLRNLLESALRSAGYRVLSAVDGRAALRLAQEHGYAIDIVVTDLVMPLLGGQELVQELRTVKPDLPAVFVSGYDARLVDSQAAASLPAGVELLQKPFSPSELMRAIRTAIVHASHR
jgi:CheY-like chemotaxis protein